MAVAAPSGRNPKKTGCRPVVRSFATLFIAFRKRIRLNASSHGETCGAG
jgi:hypothetical protein